MSNTVERSDPTVLVQCEIGRLSRGMSTSRIELHRRLLPERLVLMRPVVVQERLIGIYVYIYIGVRIKHEICRPHLGLILDH